jgi:hypothetical protein
MSVVLFLLSGIVLTLEVLETKIFAYSLENNLIFVVVAIVLLGFGAGGTVLSLRAHMGEPRRLVRANLWLMAVALVVAHVYFAHVSHLVEFAVDWPTVSTLVLLAAPYFNAGMAISAILAEPGAHVHRRYAVNLAGSALGCVTVFWSLGPLTAPQLLMVCATALALLAVALGTRARPLAAILVLAAGGVLVWRADDLLPYQEEPAPSGQLALLRENIAKAKAHRADIQRAGLRSEFDRWDPTARIQVHSLDVETSNDELRASLASVPNMWFTQDSSYGSPLIGAGVDEAGAAGFFDRTCYGVGYFRKRPAADVLVIGLGGAPDVQAALHFGARSVVCVDINRTTIAMVRDAMRDFLGNPYGDPRVEVHVRDGRSFVRGDRRLYDHIQLSGVDTKSVLAAGTLAVNESYLYTRQGFLEYLAHLKPDGLMCVLYSGEHFMHRFAVSAMSALAELGADAPHEHVILIEQSAIFGMLVKRTPFSRDECSALDAWLAAADRGGRTGVVITVFELLVEGRALSVDAPPRAVWVPDGRPSRSAIMQAAAEKRLDAALAEHQFDLSPVPDSRPFFFHVFRTRDVFANPPEYFRRLFTLMGLMAAIALLLIIGPLLVFKARGIRVADNVPFAVYFACLGGGFILSEIGLIQRYVLFLGHQAYAFAAVIGGLLVTAGLGSMLAGASRRPRAVIAVATAVICVSIFAHNLFLDDVFSWSADASMATRVAVAVVVLLPLGLPLGMLFPTGLAHVSRTAPVFVPWAFGINGVFSVIGTTLVLPGAILFGFPAMGALAAGIYVLAAAVALVALRRPAGA